MRPSIRKVLATLQEFMLFILFKHCNLSREMSNNVQFLENGPMAFLEILGQMMVFAAEG